MRVSRWGNSLAVRLPRELVETLALKEGDEIELGRAGEKALTVAKADTRIEALDRLRSTRWPVPDGYAFDREEAHDRS